MGVNKLLRFFEHDRLSFSMEYPLLGSEIGRNFVFENDSKYKSALSKFYEAGGNYYYSLEHNGIKFKQFVGAIQIHDLTIEILPKVDRDTIGENELWHGVLIDMLKACKKITPRSNQTASLNLKSNSILELYLELYIEELEYLFHVGLIKKYVKQEGNLTALKGALLFGKHIHKNLVHAERFYTRHTIYSHSHILHQVLKQALGICEKLSSSYRLTDRIKRLLLVWPEHKEVRIDLALFEKFNRDRKIIHYKEALYIAKLLLTNFRPDICGGNENVLALLFNMNTLWEEFVYRRLKECADKFGFEVYQQTKVDFWNSTTSTKTVKPDLVMVGRGQTIVIDTKWKQPDEDWPQDNDLKQMLVYKLYYHADEAILLYPNVSNSYCTDGYFNNELHYTTSVQNTFAISDKLNLGCKMGFLNVIENKHLVDEEAFFKNIKIALDIQ
ncbi:MAG: restriction endonuclease [Flavobacterium sp.]|nr:MAG: restriction endonuclease [Flavobacterium sp.]